MEKEPLRELIGAGPFGVLQTVLKLNDEIKAVNLWTYSYQRLQTEEKGNNQYWPLSSQIKKASSIEELTSLLKIDLTGDQQLAVGSELMTASWQKQHLPLMDFNLPKSNDNLSLLIDRLKYIGCQDGWILETEKSYHYWGAHPLPTNSWTNFMGRCLLTSIVHTRENIQDIADSRYIGHSLIRGCNTIRLTTRGDKKFQPKVVASLS